MLKDDSLELVFSPASADPWRQQTVSLGENNPICELTKCWYQQYQQQQQNKVLHVTEHYKARSPNLLIINLSTPPKSLEHFRVITD